MRVAWLLVVAGACEVPESPTRQHGDPPSEPTVTAPAAGVDCRLIAQTLTSLELGNYAEPEERGPRERTIAELCVRARLTRTDAECLLGATAVADLAACAEPLIVKHVAPPPLVPGDHCEQYVRALERIARVQRARRCALGAGGKTRERHRGILAGGRQVPHSVSKFRTDRMQLAC